MRIYENISYYADIPYKYTGTSSSAEMKQSLNIKCEVFKNTSLSRIRFRPENFAVHELINIKYG